MKTKKILRIVAAVIIAILVVGGGVWLITGHCEECFAPDGHGVLR